MHRKDINQLDLSGYRHGPWELYYKRFTYNGNYRHGYQNGRGNE